MKLFVIYGIILVTFLTKVGEFMQLWTAEHAVTLLPALVVMLLAAVILRFTIGNKPLRIRMIPFQILACVLLALEVGKQVLSYMEGYDLYHLPFHFCSLFIFMLPIMAFYRGKYQQKVYAVTAALCTATTLLTLIYPALIYSAGNIKEFFTDYFSFHTVAFHNIVIFACILIVALKLHTPVPKGEQKAAALFTICFCVVSATMAQLLKTNFNNFYSCNVPPLETVRLSLQATLGYGATQALYVVIVTVVDIVFVWLSYLLYRLLRRVANGRVKDLENCKVTQI